MTDNPLAAPIDRALGEYVWEDGEARAELLRDILAEIEAEFGLIRMDQRSDLGARITSEWRAES